MNARYLGRFFWDIDFENFDPQEYPRHPIFRLLEFGDERAIRWLRSQFTQAEIEESELLLRSLGQPPVDQVLHPGSIGVSFGHVGEERGSAGQEETTVNGPKQSHESSVRQVIAEGPGNHEIEFPAVGHQIQNGLQRILRDDRNPISDLRRSLERPGQGLGIPIVEDDPKIPSSQSALEAAQVGTASAGKTEDAGWPNPSIDGRRLEDDGPLGTDAVSKLPGRCRIQDMVFQTVLHRTGLRPTPRTPRLNNHQVFGSETDSKATEVIVPFAPVDELGPLKLSWKVAESKSASVKLSGKSSPLQDELEESAKPRMTLVGVYPLVVDVPDTLRPKINRCTPSLKKDSVVLPFTAKRSSRSDDP